MIGNSPTKQAYSTRERLCIRFRYKRLFLALCLLASGIVMVILSPMSLAFNRAHTLSQGSNTFSQAFEQKSSATGSKAGVNRTIRNPTDVRSKALDKLSAHMRKQVVFLRDAIAEAHRHDLKLAKDPKCKGDVIKGEVEDLLCIPKPDFIKEVRNPCWWENPDTKSILRCIPYFHILGCEKCGSSDLWDRITLHPDTIRISGIHDKEANWWGWARYGRFHCFRSKLEPFTTAYTKHFHALTTKVERSLKSGDDVHKRIVTGDGTPSDLSDFRGWVNITQNRGLKLPEVITPHLMKHIYPETTKFIVILRDPIERLYSDFCFASAGRSAQHFHENLMGAIDDMANCIRKSNVLECFFSLRMYRRGIVRLHLILYVLHIREWLKVFPRERFLFLKTEEYAKDTRGTLKKCYEFLNLKPLNDTVLRKIAVRPQALQGDKKKRAGPMWRSTKEILQEIVAPSMHFLPELLEDDRFMWNFNATPVVEH